jgi:hypothetical protein
MRDGVARLLNELKQKVVDDENTTYLILIVSDGEENASVEYSSKSIADMIIERKDTKRWTISYIGANQDLTVVAKDLGISKGNLCGYDSSGAGTADMWNTTRGATIRYMSARSVTDNNPEALEKLSGNYFTPSAN